MLSVDPVPRTDRQRRGQRRSGNDGRRPELGGEGHGRIHPPLLLMPALRPTFCGKSKSPRIFAFNPSRQCPLAVADSQHGK